MLCIKSTLSVTEEHCCTFSRLSTVRQVSCRFSVDEHSLWGHCESWGALEHPTALWSSFPQPQSVGWKCVLSPVLLVLTEPSRGIRVVVWGLGGESGVGLDGEAEANRRESIQCGTEGEEVYKGRGKETHRRKRNDKVCQTRMRINVWAVKFYCLFWNVIMEWNIVFSLSYFFCCCRPQILKPCYYRRDWMNTNVLSVVVCLFSSF